MSDTLTAADKKYLEDRYNQLVDAHCEEVENDGAEFYNMGWAQGEDFIHSKTDQGRLYSQINEDGSITHEWER